MTTQLIILLSFISALSCQAAQQWADTVMALRPGSGQSAGQGPLFFPANVLGPRSERADITIPENDPRHVCSIGMDGEIILGMKNAVVVDGAGADFAVFENAFQYASGRVFAEPAEVSVSRDGRTWITFPWDSVTLKGCAGVMPVNGKGNPFNPVESGGDVFDLADVGVDSIRWVRLRDVTRLIVENPNHGHYDPTLSGFDLDAVAFIHTAHVAFETTLKTDPFNYSITLALSGQATAALYDAYGARLMTQQLPAGFASISFAEMPRGLLFFVLRLDQEIHTIKLLR